MTKPPIPTEPREWKASDLGFDGHFISDGNGNSFDFDKTPDPVFIEKSAYDELGAEADAAKEAAEILSARVRELETELEKTKHALRLTGEGRPSEWAYTQLLNDFNKLQAQLTVARVGSGHYRSERDIHIKEQETFNAESVAKIKVLSEERDQLQSRLEQSEKKLAECETNFQWQKNNAEQAQIEFREKLAAAESHAAGLQYSFDCKQKQSAELQERVSNLETAYSLNASKLVAVEADLKHRLDTMLRMTAESERQAKQNAELLAWCERLASTLKSIKSDGNLHQDAFELNETKKEIATKALAEFEAWKGKT